MDENPVIWALIDERPGTGNQCRAVANSIGLPFIEKHLNWSTFANMPNFFIGASLRGLTTISKSRISLQCILSKTTTLRILEANKKTESKDPELLLLLLFQKETWRIICKIKILTKVNSRFQKRSLL